MVDEVGDLRDDLDWLGGLLGFDKAVFVRVIDHCEPGDAVHERGELVAVIDVFDGLPVLLGAVPEKMFLATTPTYAVFWIDARMWAP